MTDQAKYYSTQSGLRVYVCNVPYNLRVTVNCLQACKSMCMWVMAMDTYAQVYRLVQPKKQK